LFFLKVRRGLLPAGGGGGNRGWPALVGQIGLHMPTNVLCTETLQRPDTEHDLILLQNIDLLNTAKADLVVTGAYQGLSG
jgi:hypothetical protein